MLISNRKIKPKEEKEEEKEEENNANGNEKKINSEAHQVLSRESCLGFRGDRLGAAKPPHRRLRSCRIRCRRRSHNIWWLIEFDTSLPRVARVIGISDGTSMMFSSPGAATPIRPTIFI